MEKNYFKVWDKENKQMVEWEQLFREDVWTLKECFTNPELLLLMFTGLKDKNGKEIFMGDVIKVVSTEYDTPHEGIFLITAEIGHWGFSIDWENISGYSCSTHIMGDADDDMCYENVELLGNIYEQPKLRKLGINKHR